MARPKKIQVETPTTEREMAPVAVAVAPVFTPQPQPRQMQVERQGARSEPYTRRHPQVRGGVCEFCGILDGNVPSQFQYKLCPHYRGMQLRCSYCPENKDPDDILYHGILNVADSPDGQSLIAWCDSYDCSRAHEARFKRARN